MQNHAKPRNISRHVAILDKLPIGERDMTVDELIVDLKNLSADGYGGSTVCMLDEYSMTYYRVSHASDCHLKDQIVLIPNGIYEGDF